MMRLLGWLVLVAAACQPRTVERCESSAVPERAMVNGYDRPNCRENTVTRTLGVCATSNPLLPEPGLDATHLYRTDWVPDRNASYEACLAAYLSSRLFDSCPWEPDVKLVYPRPRRPE